MRAVVGFAVAFALVGVSTQACDQGAADGTLDEAGADVVNNDIDSSLGDDASGGTTHGGSAAGTHPKFAGDPADGASDGQDDADALQDASDDSNDGDANASSDAAGYCGDGVRDPLTEECDDGVVSTLEDSCTSMCSVRDLLAYQAPTDASVLERQLGFGRHPVSADANGFAVAWLEPAIPDVYATFYDAKGVPSGHIDHFGVSSTCVTSSSPVLAAVSGKYAAAWTDFGGDGDSEGIAIRLIDPSTNSAGAPSHANQTTSFSQYHPDILWTGGQVVIAWQDTSNASTGPDLRFRTFDSTLTATSNEQTLAATTASEQDVALATFGTGWAAAWRSASTGVESIVVQTSTSVAWSVGPFLPGPYDSAPGLTSLDSTHLLLVYTEGVDAADAGVANQSKIRGALLDTASPGSVTPFDITTIQVTDAGTSPSAYFPAAITTTSQYFIAWGTEAVSTDPNGEELWLKEIGWNGSTLDLTKTEIPLQRWDAHRNGDQRHAALAASPLGPSGAIASAWDDLGKVFSGEANGDVAVELLPVPVLRLSTADGGGL